GPTASATDGPGLWTVTVTATAADGATTQASVTVRSVAVTLLPPPESRYGRPVVFQGRVVPALAGEPVALYVGGRGVAAARGDGLVFEYYPGAGYQFQPLLSLAALDDQVSQQRCRAARRLASALLARAVRIGDAVYWVYDFPYQGGPVPWRSGFAQAVAAQALARAGAFLHDPALSAVAAASFRGLRQTLLMGIAGGYWIREYGFTDDVILNAQLEPIISIESYAAVAKSAAARDLARTLSVAAPRLLPRFDLGCWA